MDWDDTKIDLYLDDVLMNTTNLAGHAEPERHEPVPPAATTCSSTSRSAASNGGDPANTTFPTRYEIDYVRVFQKNVGARRRRRALLLQSSASVNRSISGVLARAGSGSVPDPR